MSVVKFKFSGDSSDALKHLDEISKKMREAAGMSQKIGVSKESVGNANGLGASFKKMLPSIAAAGVAVAAFGAAWKAAKTGIADAAADEYMAVQLSSYTKSFESAKALQSQLDHLAANGVVSLEDLGGAAQNLALHFRTNNTAIMSWEEVFADIAASGKISAEQLSNSWSKVMANGFADSRAINQLQNQGIPIIKALADEMGVAENRVIELAKKRDISADQYVSAMRKMRDAEYAGKNSALSNTTLGSWETLKATFENAVGDLMSEKVYNMAAAFKYLTKQIESAAAVNFNLYSKNKKDLSAMEASVAGLQYLWHQGSNHILALFSDDFAFEDVENLSQFKSRLKSIDEFAQPFGDSRDAILGAKSNEDINAVRTQLESERKELVNQIGAAQRYLYASGGTGIYDGKEIGQRIEFLKQELQLRDDLLYQIERGHVLLGDDKESIGGIIEANRNEAKAAEDLNEAMKKLNSTREKTLNQPLKKNPENHTAEGLNQFLSSSLNSLQLDSLDELENELNILEKKYKEGSLDFDAATRYEKLLSAAQYLQEINTQLDEARARENDLRQSTQKDIAILQAELSGENGKLRELERQRDVRKEMDSLMKGGMNEHDALGLAEKKISLEYKVVAKNEAEKDAEKNSKQRAKDISDAFKTRFDAVQQTLSSVASVGSGFGSLFGLVGKGDTGLSAAVDALTKEVGTSNKWLEKIYAKPGGSGVFG